MPARLMGETRLKLGWLSDTSERSDFQRKFDENTNQAYFFHQMKTHRIMLLVSI